MWILATTVFLPELPHVRKETLLLLLTSSVLNRSCLEEVLEPEWDTTSLVLHQSNHLVLQLF